MLLDKVQYSWSSSWPGNVPTFDGGQIMLQMSALMISVRCDTLCAATALHMCQVPGPELPRNIFSSHWVLPEVQALYREFCHGLTGQAAGSLWMSPLTLPVMRRPGTPSAWWTRWLRTRWSSLWRRLRKTMVQHSTRHRECYDETNALWVERSILQIYIYLYFYL